MNKMRALALSALVAAPFIVSCSVSVGGSTIDQDKLKSEITKTLDAQYTNFGQKVDSITCDGPGDDPAVDSTFQCIAKVSEADVRVEVTVTSDSGDVKYVTLDRLVSLPIMSKELTSSVSEKVGPVTVECGTGVKAQPTNSQFDCEATDDTGQTGRVTYFVTDKPENDHWKLN